MSNSLRSILVLIAFAFCALGCDAQTTPRNVATGPVVASADKLRGVVLDASRDPGVGALSRFADLGAGVICVVPYSFMPDPRQPDMRWRRDARWFSENADGIARMADEARTLGVRLAIKPQVWLRDGAWPGNVEMSNEADWKAWEASYREYVLFWAGVAAGVDAQVFVMGSELDQAATIRPAFWRSLASDVRTVFDGTITYAANWDRLAEIGFWKSVDAIGVQAYFPISTKSNPTAADLRAGWTPHLDVLRGVARLNDRPVLFTEVGYRSATTAAAEPWLWPENDESPVDDQLQARLYDAFFAQAWSQPWMLGAFIWKVHTDGEPRPTGFTPLGKPAEAILRRGYTSR